MAVVLVLLFVAIYLAVFLAVAGSTLYFYRRLKPRLERDPPVDWPGHESWEPAARDAELAYLGAYRPSLRMPEGLAEDLTMKLRDRVEEKYAALIAEGLEPADAIAQAISQTGSASELAKQSRRAEQTWRRLAAGVIGGLLASPGAIWAYSLLGWALALPGWFTSRFVSPPWYLRDAGDPGAEAVGMLGLSIGFFFLARTGIRICAALSHRSPASFSAAWALIGTPIVLAYILLVPSVHQSWLMLVAEVMAPIGFAVGAFYRVTKPTVWLPRLDGTGNTVTIVLGVTAIFGLVFSLSFSKIGYGFSDVSAQSRADPWPLVEVSPNQPYDAPAYISFRQPEQLGASWIGNTGEVSDVDPSGWTDLRFEVWQGVEVGNPHPPYGDNIAVARAATAPVLVAPATRVTSVRVPNQRQADLQGSVHIGFRRDGPIWYITLTGVGPDGVRYLLADPIMYRAPMSGTAWDWLTVPG